MKTTKTVETTATVGNFGNLNIEQQRAELTKLAAVLDTLLYMITEGIEPNLDSKLVAAIAPVAEVCCYVDHKLKNAERLNALTRQEIVKMLGEYLCDVVIMDDEVTDLVKFLKSLDKAAAIRILAGLNISEFPPGYQEISDEEFSEIIRVAVEEATIQILEDTEKFSIDEVRDTGYSKLVNSVRKKMSKIKWDIDDSGAEDSFMRSLYTEFQGVDIHFAEFKEGKRGAVWMRHIDVDGVDFDVHGNDRLTALDLFKPTDALVNDPIADALSVDQVLTLVSFLKL